MTATLDEGVAVAPAFLTVPPRAYSIADKVVALCRTVGREHYPEQRVALEVMCGRRADGRPAVRTSALVCARQNLKTYVLENYILARLVDPSDDARLFVWTAQQLTTTEETYRHFLEIFTSDEFPHMRRRFKRSKSTNGAAEIELTDGRRIKFKARSAKSGQGLTGDVVVLDEGFAVEPEHLGSLIPTLATRHRAQVLWGSSAAHAGSDSLREIVTRGRGGDRSLGYAEWADTGSFTDPGCASASCAHERGAAGCRLDDRGAQQAANPLAGVRLEWATIDDERKDLAPGIFARERLGWHEEPASAVQAAIPAPAWGAARDPGSRPAAEVAFGVEVSLDRRTTTIGVCGLRSDGRWHVEDVEQLPGTGAAVARIVELAARWASPVGIDPASPAASLIEALREQSVNVITPSTREISAMCGQMFDDVTADPPQLLHRGRPALDNAVTSAGRRATGDAFRWDRRGESDIAPLYAVTLARCAYQECPPGIPGVFEL